MNVVDIKSLVGNRIRCDKRNITQLISDSDVSVGALYALMDNVTDPRLSTVIKVCEQLGLELIVREIEREKQ